MTDETDSGSAAAAQDDKAYFEQRAAWHHDRAAIAPDESTCALHTRFAALYRDRASGGVDPA